MIIFDYIISFYIILYNTFFKVYSSITTFMYIFIYNEFIFKLFGAFVRFYVLHKFFTSCSC